MSDIKTEENIKMLEALYEGASMGVEGAVMLADKTTDENIHDNVVEYSKECEEIRESVRELLLNSSIIPKETPEITKAKLWLGTEVNTLFDKSASHIAEMLIQGSTMGIIEGEKDLNTYKNVDVKVKKIADEFIDVQHDFIDCMKQYLSEK